MDRSAFERLRLLPSIRRSRGYRLYAQDGRRFLDFWQEGGAGILGSRPGSSIHFIKNDLEAGRGMRLPSNGAGRLEKTALRLFPGYRAALCYSGLAEARESMREAGLAPEGAAEWKPFLPVPAGPVLLVLPPLPQAFRPALLLFEEGAASSAVAPGMLAGFQHRAAARALCDARREESEGLGQRQKGWALFEASGGLADFRREGPYLEPLEPGRYQETFERYLAGGVLLSPDPGVPSVVPGDFTAGELSFMKEARR
jgi:hypothetical protein